MKIVDSLSVEVRGVSFTHLSCNGSLNQVFKCYFGKMLYFLVVGN